MKTIQKRLHFRLAAVVMGLGIVAGCSTSQEKLLPIEDSQTMMDIWQHSTGGGSVSSLQLLDARQSLRRDLTSLSVEYGEYTRSSANEIQSQFGRLPNPDLVMYVFPHLAGSPGAEQVPIPGYSTMFPLFSSPQYAMPGETSRPRASTELNPDQLTDQYVEQNTDQKKADIKSKKPWMSGKSGDWYVQ